MKIIYNFVANKFIAVCFSKLFKIFINKMALAT